MIDALKKGASDLVKKLGNTERAQTFAGTAKRKDKKTKQDDFSAPPKEYPLVNAKGKPTADSFHKSYLTTFKKYLDANGMTVPKFVKNADVQAYLKTRTPTKKRGGTKVNARPKMMRGGVSGGKPHMYAAGGVVKDNPGLRALKAASPTAYNKITGK